MSTLEPTYAMFLTASRGIWQNIDATLKIVRFRNSFRHAHLFGTLTLVAMHFGVFPSNNLSQPLQTIVSDDSFPRAPLQTQIYDQKRPKRPILVVPSPTRRKSGIGHSSLSHLKVRERARAEFGFVYVL